MANTIIAICALVVSVAATGTAVWSAVLQRRYMRLSVRPIASIGTADYEDRVSVSLKNRGLGPMLVKTLRVSKKEGETHRTVLDHMPELERGIIWRDFYGIVDGRTLENGKKFNLVVLEGDSGESVFRTSRDKVRKSLKDLTITVEYEDLYGTPMEVYKKDLSWFGREK